MFPRFQLCCVLTQLCNVFRHRPSMLLSHKNNWAIDIWSIICLQVEAIRAVINYLMSQPLMAYTVVMPFSSFSQNRKKGVLPEKRNRWRMYITHCYWKCQMAALSWWVGCVNRSRKKCVCVCVCVIACVYACQLVCVDVWAMSDKRVSETAAVKHYTATQSLMTTVNMLMLDGLTITLQLHPPPTHPPPMQCFR